MSAMRTCALLCLLATAPLVLGHEGSPGPTRLGTVIGRVIEPGARGKALEGAAVKLDGDFTQLAAVTDSTGAFRLTAPGHHHATYGIQLELTGYECDWYGHGVVTISPDSVTRLPDLIMWPVRYFDWATYKEFMSAPSVEVRTKDRAGTGPLVRDSALLRAYRHYLHPGGPLVVRTMITPPFRELIAKQAGVEVSLLPDPGWPDIKEYGVYVFIDKGRCRLMDVRMWMGKTGMRLWDVDSMVPGSINPGGFLKRSEDCLGRSGTNGLMLYLHPRGTQFVSSRGSGTYD